MGKKVQEGVTGADFTRMCERMIMYANRGRKQSEIVKSIAKAGNIAPVMDYILRFQKLLVKFNAEQQTEPTAATGNGATRTRAKRNKRKANDDAGEGS